MNETVIGSTTIVNGDSLRDISNQPNSMYSLVNLDPHFTWTAEQLYPWIAQSERILKDGGNLVIVNYPITCREIFYYIKDSINSLTLKDTISTMLGSATKITNGLPRRQVSIDVYFKGNEDNRIFYPKILHKYGRRLYAPEKENILTDAMNYKQNYPCRKGKNGKVIHKGAMPKWLVNNILHCFVRENDTVYDAFGGAGTFPAICNQNNIKCRSVEIELDNIEIIKTEVSSSKYRTYNILNAFITTVENIKNENSSRTTNRLEGSTEGRIGHREETTT